MGILTDSSEIQEALSLFRDLVGSQGDLVNPRTTATAQTQGPPFPGDAGSPVPREPQYPDDVFPSQLETTPKLPTDLPVPGEVEGEYRGDRLENALFAMCRRGGFSGAILTDDSGLPIAAHNSPVETDRIAAFTSILGGALSKAGRFLEQHSAEYLSMDINYEDKVVVRRFRFEKREMYLLVLCSQTMDERAEVEMTIQQVVSELESEAL